MSWQDFQETYKGSGGEVSTSGQDATVPPPVTSTQVGGDHYRKCAIQPIDYVVGNELGWCEGNIVYYVTRWKDKGGVEDLRKARHYLEYLMERVCTPTTQP